MTIKQFEDFEAWKNGRKLVNHIYDMTNQGSFAKDFGLREQMRRASVSVISNIAEGYESRAQSLFIDYLGRAKGSAGEVRAQLYIALDRKYINQDEFEVYSLSKLISRQLYRLIEYLETQPNSRRIKEEQVEYQIQPET